MFTHRSASKVNANISSTAKAHIIRGAYVLLLSFGIFLIFFSPHSSGNISKDGPPCTDDTWTPTSTTNAPDGRMLPTAVWTGSEMIVWGGTTDRINGLNTGGRYNPSTDSWTATTTTNAPTGRSIHTAVWTGSEMIVWGGEAFDGSFQYLDTGGRYNPGTDSWIATSTSNAPSAREVHTAVWTGSEMIVWGGGTLGSPFNTGGRYNPNTDSWTATSTTNAPSAPVLSHGSVDRQPNDRLGRNS